jgi:hypothetical protein
MISPDAPFVELDLESQIDWNAHQLHTAPTPEERAAAWERLKKLHQMRTPEKAEELERARGIRR